MTSIFRGQQPNFNIVFPAVVKALSPLSEVEQQSGQQWCYPTFQDVYNFQVSEFNKTAPNSTRLLKQLVAESFLKLEGRSDEYVVLLPDSPMFCADFFKDEFRHNVDNIIRSIQSILDTGARDKNISNVIIDLPPGLFGLNGAILKWISRTYQALPVMVSSPRVSDLSAAIYESSWMSSLGEFDWTNGMLLLVNMWPQKGLSLKSIDHTADILLRETLKIMTKAPSYEATSFLMVFVRRMWSYLHAVNIKSPSNRMHVELLPYDDSIRKSSHLPAYLRGLGVDSLQAAGNDMWYQLLRQNLISAVEVNNK